VGVAVRTATAVVLLLVAYYQAPLDRSISPAVGVLFVSALVAGALAVVVEVRAILSSEAPMVKAIRVIALGLPLLLVLFAATYITVAGQQADAFSEPLNRTDGLYFTMTTFATVGYGDIVPLTQLARALVMIQMLVGLVAVGVIAKVVLGAARMAKDRLDAAERADRAEPS
jgi:voltage-gated potassium channel